MIKKWKDLDFKIFIVICEKDGQSDIVMMQFAMLCTHCSMQNWIAGPNEELDVGESAEDWA